MKLFDRAHEWLDQEKPFGMPALRLGSGDQLLLPEKELKILRMPVCTPETDNHALLPEELTWLRESILAAHKKQVSHDIFQPYIYVTVRHGPVTSVTDDEWHVDGFSMRKPHIPEQNYIWASHTGTEVLQGPVYLPKDFDGLRHNIHHYFQDYKNYRPVQQLESKCWYVIDPYVIHRRPKLAKDTWRTFIRITFCPIEIESDTCAVNPLIPRKEYNVVDFREQLIRY